MNPWGDRLTTMQVRMHRFILPEFNTHRVFSRNSASSRARPIALNIQQVREDPALPLHWGKNQSGMQAREEFDGYDREVFFSAWRIAASVASGHAEHLAGLGLHKQVVNRLLEPFLWHDVVVSSTEWENFFRQRCHPDAQPEMQALANAMREALEQSTPEWMDEGGTHYPYITEAEWDMCLHSKDLEAISVARCARVSYKTFDGVTDSVKDIELFKKLVASEPKHLSPLEHVAWPEQGCTSGNFKGWRQLRKDYE